VARRIVDLEGKIGPVTRAELEAVINAFARTLARYVPETSSKKPKPSRGASLPLPAGDETTAK